MGLLGGSRSLWSVDQGDQAETAFSSEPSKSTAEKAGQKPPLMGPANDEEEHHEDENASKDGNSDAVALHQFPSIGKNVLADRTG